MNINHYGWNLEISLPNEDVQEFDEPITQLGLSVVRLINRSDLTLRKAVKIMVPSSDLLHIAHNQYSQPKDREKKYKVYQKLLHENLTTKLIAHHEDRAYAPDSVVETADIFALQEGLQERDPELAAVVYLAHLARVNAITSEINIPGNIFTLLARQ